MEKREDVTVKKGWGLGKANKPEKKRRADVFKTFGYKAKTDL